MIKVNGKITSYADTVDSLISCALAHKGKSVDIRSTTGGAIQVRYTEAYTEDDFIIEAAIKRGLTITTQGLLGKVIRL